MTTLTTLVVRMTKRKNSPLRRGGRQAGVVNSVELRARSVHTLAQHEVSPSKEKATQSDGASSRTFPDPVP